MRASARSPGRLLERGDDLARIERSLASARAGAGTLVVVEGSAGVGKTALLADVRAIADAAGMRVLRSRGAELEREFAFGVVRQLLEPVLRGMDDAEPLLRGPAGVAAELLRLPGAPARDGAPFADQDSAFAALHGLYWLCADLAEQRPLCMVVDDAHWADGPSLRFLGFLVPRLEELSLALVVAARSREATEQAALLESLMADVGAEAVSLAPLTAGAVAELIGAGRDGVAPDPAFVEACHRATGGLAFLVRQLVEGLREGGIAPDEAGAPLVARFGGRTVGRWIALRLGRLGPGSGRLARALAVLETATTAQAGALAGLGRDDAVRAADALEAVGILAAGRPLAFAHPMVREALYAELSPAERSGAHRDAARLLHEAGAGPERVAEHLLAAEPAGDGWVVDRLVEAARLAAASGAPASAAVHLRRALAEPPRRDLPPPARLRARGGERGRAGMARPHAGGDRRGRRRGVPRRGCARHGSGPAPRPAPAGGARRRGRSRRGARRGGRAAARAPGGHGGRGRDARRPPLTRRRGPLVGAAPFGRARSRRAARGARPRRVGRRLRQRAGHGRGRARAACPCGRARAPRRTPGTSRPNLVLFVHHRPGLGGGGCTRTPPSCWRRRSSNAAPPARGGTWRPR